MTGGQFAWVTHAPADYMLVFSKHSDGEHAVVGGRFEDHDQLREAARGLEGAEVDEAGLNVYCTLPGEAEEMLARVRRDRARASWIETGTVAFVAAGDGSGASSETASTRQDASVRVVLSLGGNAPRCYRFDDQCTACGEFRGKINVLPGCGVLIDTRRLSCRCESIPCHYCQDGEVRRPLTEHFDPERRAGCTPWFGYLVPCGRCQAASRGPRVLMSKPDAAR
jgi:hypothetical protein